MKENKKFYQCKNIYEQLTLVMREILSKELSNVIINIPVGDDFTEILNFLDKRMFKYTFNQHNEKVPTIRITEEIIEDDQKVNFYISCEKFINKEKLLIKEYLNSTDSYKYMIFTDLEEEFIKKIHDKNYEINNYGVDFIEQLLPQNNIEDNLKENDKNIINGHIVNKQIRNKFLETFFIAESEIDIISPWINGEVVDNELINLMERALNKKVKIKILYGIGNDERSKKTDAMAQQLIQRFSIYNGLFTMKKTNTHYKLLLCDDKYAISGSYNFLSFRGDYDGNDDRGEGAEHIDNKESIINRRKYYFDF